MICGTRVKRARVRKANREGEDECSILKDRRGGEDLSLDGLIQATLVRPDVLD